MRLAPKTQYEIPFLVWTSDGFRRYKPTASQPSPSAGQLPPVLEQHYIFHSVLNLLSIQSPAYDESLSLFE
jgi:lipid A ethanolaminephosphotransferase